MAKTINDIDAFVLKTVRVISEYTDYVIVSGYVAIFFGRSRGSEDIDLFIKEMNLPDFKKLYNACVTKGLTFTLDNPEELYQEYLMRGIPIGLWEGNYPLLRIDMKFPRHQSQALLFSDRFKAIFDNNHLWFASIESTIAYKEQIAKSEKDLLDSSHLRSVFNVDDAKIENYKKMFNQEFHQE